MEQRERTPRRVVALRQMAAGDELVLGRPQQALPALGVFDN
jgi:hypothetical protein